VRAINHCVLLLTRLASEMGFTPAARAGLPVPGAAESADDDGWNMLGRLRVIDGRKPYRRGRIVASVFKSTPAEMRRFAKGGLSSR
jgi:hypothetical protein